MHCVERNGTEREGIGAVSRCHAPTVIQGTDRGEDREQGRCKCLAQLGRFPLLCLILSSPLLLLFSASLPPFLIP